MLTYATTADLTADGWKAPEGADLAGLLRHASALVAATTAGAVYPTTRAGAPADPYHAEAFRVATVLQVQYWAANGLDPAAGALAVTAAPVAASKAIRGASVSYDTGAAREHVAARVAALTTLAAPAWNTLWAAGLITAVVR